MLMPCPLVCLSAQRRHTHPLQTQTHTHTCIAYTPNTYTHTHPPCLAVFLLQSNVASRRRSGSTACLAFVIGCHWWPRCGFIFLLISSFPGCSFSSAPGTGPSSALCQVFNCWRAQVLLLLLLLLFAAATVAVASCRHTSAHPLHILFPKPFAYL